VTAVRLADDAPATETPAPLRRVLIAVIANDIQIGMLTDAHAPIGMQTPALVDVVNTRLTDIGQPPLTTGAGGRGRWALCWVDGTPLRAGRSLTEQGVFDGTTLWLQFLADTEARAPVIEHITSAIPAQLRTRWPAVTAPWAARVGVTLVAVAVALVAAVLVRWRYTHPGPLAATAVGVVAVLALTAATVVGIRSARNRRTAGDPRALDPAVTAALGAELFVADVLLLTGAAASALSAALAVPGPLAAAHAGLGAAILMAGAVLIVRFTGRHITLCTTVFVLATAVLVAGAARMLAMTSAVTLLASLLLVALVGIKLAPGFARIASDLRLPVFPSASGRWIFETRPDLPSAVVVPSGEAPTLEGPESVRAVVVSVDRAHSFLTGLLGGFGALLVVCATGLCDPHAGRRWLPVVLATVSAGAVLLHARSYTDRRQSTLLAVCSVAVVLGVCLRFAVGLWTPAAVLIGCAVMLAVCAAGLAAAAVIPAHIYSPMFKQLVEWVGYLLLIAPFPLAFWLMNVFAAIRYRT
jgi:type VII secretion integral membrane protein EccD